MLEERMELEDDESGVFMSYDPVVILLDIVKRWYTILLVTLLAGMAAFVLTEVTYRPVYSTQTTFVVSEQKNVTTSYQNLNAVSNLAIAFSKVLNSSIMRESVLEARGLGDFSGQITTESIPETNLLTLVVTGSDPTETFQVTRAIIEDHKVVSQQIMGKTVLDVLQKPVVPAAPSNPLNAGGAMKKVMLLTAVAMCALLGVLSFMRDNVRSREEAEEKLDEQVLTELHHERKSKSMKMLFRKNKSSILIINPATSFSYVEKINQLRRQVEQRLPRGGKVILVTSVLENEGKSTVAVNLALSFAKKKKNVLLIDGDLRQPACYKVLEQKWTGSGICDVMTGRAQLMDTVVNYKLVKHMSLLLEEKERAGSSDLVSGSSMNRLLQEARAQFDYVVVDTPPMSAGSDAEGLADLVDGSVLVVRQNMASAAALNKALDILEESRSKHLGCVLNDVHSSVLSEGRGYDYSYGYGYGKYGKYGTYGAYQMREGAGEKAGGKYDK